MGVGKDGAVLFDIFLTNDLARIDAALAEYGKPGNGTVSPRASDQREAVEAEYLAADRAARVKLLTESQRSKHEPYGLIRLGLHDEDPGLRELARKALAATATPAALPLVLQTLDDEPDRQARATLVPTLAKIGDDSPETALARKVHEAMLKDPKVPDRAAWLAALRGAGATGDEVPDDDIDARIEELSQKAAGAGASAATLLELGTLTLRFARAQMAAGKDVRFLLADAQQAAQRAVAKAGDDPKTHALSAEVAQLLGEREAAARHARRALPALRKAGAAASAQAGAVLLALAEGAAAAIYAAEGSKAAWDGELLAEADAAYSVLAAHSAGTAAHALSHASLLGFLGLRGCARQAVEAALQRFPADAALHERLRTLVTAAHGIEALTSVYADLAPDAADPAAHAWFAGLAEILIAEDCKRRGDDAEALAAYTRGVDSFLDSQRRNPAYAESASWYVAMGRAGQARVRLDQGDAAEAAHLLAEAIKRLPAVAEREDGLGRTPLFTLKQVLAKLSGADGEAVRAAIEKELSAAAPQVWAKANAN
jgi:hypothetical protein